MNHGKKITILPLILKQNLSICHNSNLHNHSNLYNHNSHSKKKLRVCYVKYIPWQPNIPEIFDRIYQHLSTLSNLKFTTDRLEYYHTKLPEALKNHPAILFSHDDVTVKCEWLEKQEISWWSLYRLKHVLNNGGKFKKNIFRLGFLSTLSLVLDHFIQHPSLHSQELSVFKSSKSIIFL
jgi:hypothetical protein